MLGLLATILLCTRCVERDIVLPSQPVDPQLVVLAYLVDNAPAEVFISKLFSIYADTIDYGVPNAVVKLYRNDSLETTLLYSSIYNSTCSEVTPSGQCPFRGSKYISVDSITLQDDAIYRIEVQAAGFPIVHSDPVVFNRNLQNLSLETVVTDTVTGFNRKRKALTIDTIAVDYAYTGVREDLLYLYLNYDLDSRESSGWQGSMLSPTYEYRIPLSHVGGNQQFIKPGNVIGHYYSEFPIENSFSVHVTRYPVDYVRFYESVQAQDLEISGLYAGAPSPIPTNMTGGLGYFVILENYIGDYYVLQ